MALALGTNVGFVLTAPTADPAGTGVTSDGSSFVVKDTAPTGAVKITEVGWYKSAGTTSSNTQVGLYADSSGTAGTRLQVTGDQASGTSADVWIRFTGLDWPVTAGVAYWLGMQQDSHTGSSNIDSASSGGSGIDTRTSQTALTNPYGGGAVSDADGMYSIYAVYQTAPTVALNTPTDTATGQSTTPTLNFTGTDTQSDTIEYNVQVDTATLDSANPLNLKDNFNDNSLNTDIWSNWASPTSQVQETNNRLEITGTTSAAYYGIDTTPLSITNGYLSLIGKSISVQLVDAGNTAIASWDVGPVNIDGNTMNGDDTVWWHVINDGGTVKIRAEKRVATVASVLYSATYDSSVHKYFRIRESGGTTYWDTSTDGKSWTNRYSEANPISLTTVLMNIFVGTWQAEASATKAIFDNCNIFPYVADAFSADGDAGFTAGHPFASGAAKEYTVQSALSNSTTYYWRVRGIDTGSNTYGAWPTTFSFTTTAGGGGPTAVPPRRMLMGVGT